MALHARQLTAIPSVALAARLYGSAKAEGIETLSEAEKRSFKFEIKGTMPSLNEYDSQHSSWHTNAALKRRWTNAVATCAGLAAKGRSYDSVFIEIRWIEKNKKRDKDNIAFAKKFILDGLVKAGIIANDGWKEISGWSESFAVDKLNPRIEITVHGAEETSA